MPLERPVTTHAFVVVVHANAPGEETALYEVMAEPPSDDGVLHRTATRVSPVVAVTFNGSEGAVAAARGVTVTVADAGLVPYEFTDLMRTDTGTSGVIFVSDAVVAVLTPSFHTVHVDDAFTLYSTM
jgi:hypothetical protein